MKPLPDFDFTTRKIEKNEELDAAAWAENNGWIVRKIQYQGRVGCPDRLFAGYGKLFLIEMKKPAARKRKNGGLSAGQSGEIKRFAEVEVEIKVFYTGPEVIEFLRSHMPSEKPFEKVVSICDLL
ncbi:hypothetical protein L905_19330 [Agrobacterium sp. TS43]|uniref:hypothetical protein n=1 Tax=Agrobacterium TaxID=357 RepID=UPI000555A60D|nr:MULTISPECIES: hypothetical protein [Agrobacterium]KVK49541.1 hypothetical protein L903_19690 [Agrobacterium sp. JL28]KVK49778.1 hypothetical protein L904_19680 [Agrobacterium sp. LY4]KVK62719.1 hypothetical protein L906_18805 [Agrobacterium sp. TS45]KVK65104.1 hypothetical protein L905_19330 [Agrobacterium sp. TS43]KVK67170.1 hypothetical protein L907_18785 [Agrobacterium sp. C13]